jgi:hypothetical protein
MASKPDKKRTKKSRPPAKRLQSKHSEIMWYIQKGMCKPDGFDSTAVGFNQCFRSEKEAREAWKTAYPRSHPSYTQLMRWSHSRDGRVRIEIVDRRECFGPFREFWT